MIYLYAGLGIAMLSGIMAIFEMGLAVTGQSLLRSPEESYFGDIATKDIEKRFMQNLYDGNWDKEFINAIPPVPITCSNLPAVQGYSWELLKVGLFNGSCAANNANHRILIELGEGVRDYRVYTCFLENGDGQCSFEQGS
jgi:hypothetical protein